MFVFVNPLFSGNFFGNFRNFPEFSENTFDEKLEEISEKCFYVFMKVCVVIALLHNVMKCTSLSTRAMLQRTFTHG